MRISDWSSDVCSSDLARLSPGTIDHFLAHGGTPSYDRLLAISDALRIDRLRAQIALQVLGCPGSYYAPGTILASRLVARLAEAISHPDNEPEEELNSWQTEAILNQAEQARSEEHTSELQSLMRISYAVFCLKKKNYKLNL